jgi:PAS domain S-box-containing protein
MSPPATTSPSGRALSLAEARLRLALSASRVGLWYWAVGADTVEWDSALCAIFGVEDHERPHSYAEWRSVLHPDDRERVEAHVAEAARTGSYPDIEHRIVRKDGADRWIHASGSVLYDESGACEGLLGAVVDVTEQRMLEERLRLAHRMEAVAQLAQGVAHNLNNALAAVIPNIDFALRGADPAAAACLIEARVGAVRASETVREILRVAQGPDDLGMLAMSRATTRPRVTPSAPDGRGERVLVVDDERALRRVLRALLEGAGYRVIEASDGVEALEILGDATAAVDVMILDHSMPRATGAEVLDRMPAARLGVPVLLYSGVMDTLRGASAAILKPADPELILQKVRELLDARAAL